MPSKRRARLAGFRIIIQFFCIGACMKGCVNCGDKGTRTPDLLGADEALSQLSLRPPLWGKQDLNLRPHAYQACALTS